jgi:hypothetical protein
MAILAMAAVVPLIAAGDVATTRPIAHSQSRVVQLADCVQRAAREFCRVPSSPSDESISFDSVSLLQSRSTGVNIPHDERILLQEEVINLPPPAL